MSFRKTRDKKNIIKNTVGDKNIIKLKIKEKLHKTGEITKYLHLFNDIHESGDKEVQQS